MKNGFDADTNCGAFVVTLITVIQSAIRRRRSEKKAMGVPSRLSLIVVAAIALSGCETIVRTTINTANKSFDAQEAVRNKEIWTQSVARYKSMAEAGNPQGLYYMAVAHAILHEHDPDGDVHTVMRLYEEAIEKGSNDARVALGRMLIWGDSYPFVGNSKLSQELRNPPKGVELLTTAAKHSCTYAQPLVNLGRCRERMTSIPSRLWVLYRDGAYFMYEDTEKLKLCGVDDTSCRIKAMTYVLVVAKDAEQASYWKGEYDRCQPIIQETNKRLGCYE